TRSRHRVVADSVAENCRYMTKRDSTKQKSAPAICLPQAALARQVSFSALDVIDALEWPLYSDREGDVVARAARTLNEAHTRLSRIEQAAQRALSNVETASTINRQNTQETDLLANLIGGTFSDP